MHLSMVAPTALIVIIQFELSEENEIPWEGHITFQPGACIGIVLYQGLAFILMTLCSYRFHIILNHTIHLQK